MKQVPNILECAYCKRNSSHGGECRHEKSPYSQSGCVIFLPDERGCIRNADLSIPIPLYGEFPKLHKWCDQWSLYGNDTEVRIQRIYGFDWDTKKGYLTVHCNADYFINEYCDSFIESKEKPKLKRIK